MSTATLSDSWRVWKQSTCFQIRFWEAADIHYNLPKAFSFRCSWCISFIMLPCVTCIFLFSTFFCKNNTPQLQLSQGQVTLAQPGMTFFLDAAFMAASYLPWRQSATHGEVLTRTLKHFWIQAVDGTFPSTKGNQTNLTNQTIHHLLHMISCKIIKMSVSTVCIYIYK